MTFSTPKSEHTEPKPEPKKRVLGRGLDALLPAALSSKSDYGSGAVFSCPIEKIVPQPNQPRQHFEIQSLDELASSIVENGLLHPLVVRKVRNADQFELIAGERRWRACQKAGLKDVLVVVKDVTPEKAFELAIFENVQREDLNPVELAEAYQRLIEEYGYTQELLASKLGKSRVSITNSMRLLKLPPRVRGKVISGELSEGHARALLGLTEPHLEGISERVLRGRWSVRKTEMEVRKIAAKGKSSFHGSLEDEKKIAKSPVVRDLEARLMRKFGVQCEVKEHKKGGELVIPYADLDQLDRILEKLL